MFWDFPRTDDDGSRIPRRESARRMIECDCSVEFRPGEFVECGDSASHFFVMIVGRPRAFCRICFMKMSKMNRDFVDSMTEDEYLVAKVLHA
jgi:hypothetical protein